MKLACALVAVACGSPARPQPPRSAPYLLLFERGRRWSLPIESVTGQRSDTAWPATKTERATVTCEVADVKPVGNATVSRISCAPPHAGLLVVGTWVATPAGLYHPALPVDDPDEVALLGEDDLLLPALAKERQHSHVEAGAQQSIEAFTFHASWCVRDTVASEPDRRTFTLCFDSQGVTGGGELVITDKTWHREQFGVAPPDPDDPTTNPND